MQIICKVDNLHEMSNQFSINNKKKYQQFVNCWICPEIVDGYVL